MLIKCWQKNRLYVNLVCMRRIHFYRERRTIFNLWKTSYAPRSSLRSLRFAIILVVVVYIYFALMNKYIVFNKQKIKNNIQGKNLPIKINNCKHNTLQIVVKLARNPKKTNWVLYVQQQVINILRIAKRVPIERTLSSQAKIIRIFFL